MSVIPSKRILVYAAAGFLVLAVGAVGLVVMRQPGGVQTEGMVLDVGPQTNGATSSSMAPGAGLSVLPVSTSMSNSTTTEALIFVQVAGAVGRPGVYQVPAESRAFQAVMQAGGFTAEADQEVVPLAARLSDGCRLYVPRKGETATGPVLSGQTSAAGGSPSAPAGPVSINSATLEQLDALPGIGPALAQQIISYRDTKGPFASIEELSDVPGIGPSKLEQLRPLVGL